MLTLGPHNIGQATGHAREWAARAAIVKQVDGTDLLAAAPPGAVRIFRHYFAQQPLDADPYDVAYDVLNGLGGYRHELLFAELYNEPGQDTDRLIALYRGAVPILHAAGVKVCGPCWSTGAFWRRDWEAFRAAGWCGLDAIAVHGYFGNAGLTDWHALRYRQYWAPNVDPKLLFVTEAGRDEVEGGGRGWRKSSVSAAQYVLELTALSREYAEDGVLGVVFQEGSSDPQWDAFSTEALELSPLYINGGQSGTEVPPMPDPIPTAPTVGEGVQAAMNVNGDHPITSEVYVGPDWSIAVGEKGAYIYSKQLNRVRFLSPTGPDINAALSTLADQLVYLSTALKEAVSVA